jgi:hypothetical protein
LSLNNVGHWEDAVVPLNVGDDDADAVK